MTDPASLAEVARAGPGGDHHRRPLPPSTASRWSPRAPRPAPTTSTSPASRSSWTGCGWRTTPRPCESGARLVHACGLRLHPARPGRAVHRAAAARRRADHAARRGPVQRHLLRRHLPHRDHGDVPAPPGAGGRGDRAGPSPGRKGGPPGPSPGKPHRDPVLGYWLLPLPDDRPDGRGRSGAALPAYGPKFRYSALRRHQDAAVRRRRRRRRVRGGPGGAGRAAAVTAAGADPGRRGPRRGAARPVLVHRRLRRRGRRTHRAHPRVGG